MVEGMSIQEIARTFGLHLGRNCFSSLHPGLRAGIHNGDHQPSLRRVGRGLRLGTAHRSAAGPAHPPHVHILEMNGESYRLKRSRENAASQAPDNLEEE